MKILVTGGAGFIGRYLVNRLVSETRDSVTILDDCSRPGLSAAPDLPDSAIFLRGDILDGELLSRAMEAVEVVYHLAAVSSVGAAQANIPRAYQVNIHGVEAVLRAARAAGVRRVIFASSREVYGEPAEVPVPESAAFAPTSVYGLTKAAGESCCRLAEDLEIAILRLANVYGPGDHGRVIPIFVEAALLSKPIDLFGGDQILDFVWIEHVVDAFIAASTSDALPGRPMNIGSGIGTPILELARAILDLTGSSSPVRCLPAIPFEVRRFVADPGLAREALGLIRVSDPLMGLKRVLESAHRQLVRR
jgi:nucleoside-diphosphate-sugar epimerase